ncbi:MAG: hypothetical protein JO185_10200 [Acidobacteriaceae bacterium]|nr:hypothetical protein [Acidobacteriaceae bacterium]
MTDTQAECLDLASFSQLVQEVITGSVRRHTFTRYELELLFDLQRSRLRKSSRPDVLRRYLRAVQHHFAEESSLLPLSAFLERQNEKRAAPSVASPALGETN